MGVVINGRPDWRSLPRDLLVETGVHHIVRRCTGSVSRTDRDVSVYRVVSTGVWPVNRQEMERA